jgi:hypothetical protein
VIALAVACAAPAAATDVIDTPGSEVVGPSTRVPRRHVQSDRSVARLRVPNAGTYASMLTTPVLPRYGVSGDVEFRLGSQGYARTSLGDVAAHVDTNATGVQDPASGVEWPVAEGDGMRPAVAVAIYGDVEPELQGTFKDEGVKPSIRSTLEWRLSHDFSVAASPGLVYDKTDGKRHPSGMLGVALGKAWTPTFSTYVEAAADRIASSRRGGSTVTYNLGGTYLMGDVVQIDSALSWGGAGDTTVLGWTVGLWMQF